MKDGYDEETNDWGRPRWSRLNYQRSFSFLPIAAPNLLLVWTWPSGLFLSDSCDKKNSKYNIAVTLYSTELRGCRSLLPILLGNLPSLSGRGRNVGVVSGSMIN